MSKLSAKQYARVLFDSVQTSPAEAQGLVRLFVKQLMRRRDKALLPFISAQLSDMELAKNNQEKVLLKTAKPISESIKQELVKMIKDKKWSRPNPVIEEIIDSKLVLGFQIQIQDRLYDFSAASQLNQFEQNVLGKGKA